MRSNSLKLYHLPVIKKHYKIKSQYLLREVGVDIYVPENLLGNETINLLVVNDGQDLSKMAVEEVFSNFYEKRKIEPTLVVGVYAGEERLLEYGVANKPDFKLRGSKAHLYTNFVLQELLPFVINTTGYAVSGKKAIAGFSLGGLTAFDIAWQTSNVFDTVGVFSGSFWWRERDLNEGYTEKDRIVHNLISNTLAKEHVRFWLMTGTEDETADRNKNFIIDSIDDTIDVVKELAKKGIKRPHDVFYYEMVGGKHDVESWAKAFPKFVEWAFSK